MTNKIVLKEVDEFMSGYTPVYQPVFSLLLGGKTKKYSSEVGQVTQHRLEAVGDIRSKHITPKDTEIKEIQAKDVEKIFKKYFLSSQFIQSTLQNPEGIEDVVGQALDEHNKHQDDLLFLGEGTSNSTMKNNGLFWSSDSNYVLETSEAVAAGSDAHLSDLHVEMMETATKANTVAGRKVMMVYGATAVSKLSALHASSTKVFRTTLQEALGSNWSIVEVPSDVALGNVNGWIAVNMDQIMTHYTVVPQLLNQGVNAEKGHSWHNFLMGSMMVEVLASKGIVHQPCTFA